MKYLYFYEIELLFFLGDFSRLFSKHKRLKTSFVLDKATNSIFLILKTLPFFQYRSLWGRHVEYTPQLERRSGPKSLLFTAAIKCTGNNLLYYDFPAPAALFCALSCLESLLSITNAKENHPCCLDDAFLVQPPTAILIESHAKKKLFSISIQ